MQLSNSEYSSISTWQFFSSVLTALYALVLTIIAVIFELSPTWKEDIWMAQIIFHYYMYIMAIIYLCYCYVFMIYPQSINWILHKLRKTKWLIKPTSYTGEGAGTLYLRLGALSFGTLGIVLYGMEIYLTFEQEETNDAFFVAEHITAIIFTFLQMHFIFCHSKIRLIGPSKVSKLGMMHLISVNLWTWCRYVTEKEILEVHEKIITKGHSTTDGENANYSISSLGHSNGTKSPIVVEWKYVSSSFANLTSFFTTCIVEYSLIGAAVMFILWRSIDTHMEPMERVKRKGHMRIDCSRTSRGLFAGILYVILSFVSIGIYGIDTSLGVDQTEKIYGIVNIVLFDLILIACIMALWRIRLLQYRLHPHGEVIDEILLVIGLIGELIYCFIGIDQFISSRNQHKVYRSLLPLFVFISRAIQVIVQTMLILTVSRLRCYSPQAIKHKYGKQSITFLLVANMSLFVFQTFENMSSSLGIDSSSADIYLTIVSIVAPLLVFYRFHSSVCLAEAWKHTYADKALTRRSSLGTLMTDEMVEEPFPKFN